MPRISRRMSNPEDFGNDPNASPTKMAKQQFAAKLWKMMLHKGWTQAELARRAGLGRDVVSSYINAHSLPTMESRAKLASALEVEASDLYPVDPMMAATAPAPSAQPPVEMKTVGDGRVFLRINMELPLTTAVNILALVQGVEP